MRLIDADTLNGYILTAEVGKVYRFCFPCKEIQQAIDEQPTVEERKKGEWIRHDEIKNIYGGICIECSECGEKYVVRYIEDEKFCRNCGADMRGKQDG